MKTSCINHKPGTMIAILRQDYLDICDNHVGAAFLLSFFEYWHNIKLEMSVKNRQANDIAEKHGDPPTQDTSLYQFHNAEQIYSSMMGAVGRPAIKDGIDALVKKGFITVHKNPNPRYAFDSTKHFLLHPHKINETIGLQKLSKPIRENCQTGLQKPLNGLTETARTSPETSSETSSKNKTHRYGGKTTDTPTNGSNPRSYPTRKGIEQRLAAFAVFRAAYPRKVAMAKAEAAWEKINPDESLVSTILASLDVQRKSENWTKENGRFIPYPATWLNQRRWEDEINGDPDDDVPSPRRVLAIVEDMGGNKIKLEDGTTMRKDLYEQRFGVKPGVGMGNAGAGAHPVDEILRARGEWES